MRNPGTPDSPLPFQVPHIIRITRMTSGAISAYSLLNNENIYAIMRVLTPKLCSTSQAE